MDTKKANEILLRRNKIVLPPTAKEQNVAQATTFSLNLQSLGYVLAPEVIQAISWLTEKSRAQLFKEIIDQLKVMRGVQRYMPMYPNFPTQVMEASDAELYLNALLHYFSVFVSDVTGTDAMWLPKYVKNSRKPLEDKVQLTILRLADENDLRMIATALATSNTSLSPSDKEDLKWLVQAGYLELPASIPNKENLSLVGALVLGKIDVSHLFKTATDVLRLAVALNDGDVSLAAPTKFSKLNRKQRRALLQMLENCGNSRLEDMLRWRGRWLRLGERLHPGEFADRYPATAAAFVQLRSGENVPTIRTGVEQAVRAGEIRKAVTLLVKRPGDFARRLDHLLRMDVKCSELILDAFDGVIQEVSTPVLLQVIAHFQQRQTENDLRVVFPKGSLAKVQAISNDLLPIPHNVCRAVVMICEMALFDRFRGLDPLGKVYLDPKLSTYLLPFSQRSASKSLRTLVRGSQIPLVGDGGTVRFFIWWKNLSEGYGRVDVDLSAVLYDADWNMLETVAYYNLRSGYGGRRGYTAVHSGDITDAPNGACEFIDVDIESMLKFGARYVVMNVNNFTGHKFSEIPEASAGWMMRQQPKSGEVFEPKTVVDRLDLTAEAQIAMPLIIDLAERKVIWCDAVLKRNVRYVNNVRGNSEQVALVGRAFTQVVKPNVYQLLQLHATARGTLVQTPEEADVVFSVEANTPFELERLASEFMTDGVKAAVAEA